MVYLDDIRGFGIVFFIRNIKVRFWSVKVFLNCKIFCNIKFNYIELINKEGYWWNLFKKLFLSRRIKYKEY